MSLHQVAPNRIAILGASGHIGSALASYYIARKDVALDLYSRSPERAAARVPTRSVGAPARHLAFDRLDLSGCDIVINAIGAGDPRRLRTIGTGIVPLTLAWEDRLSHALDANPQALYVFLSSGAVYGRLVEGPGGADSATSFFINKSPPEDAYRLAKFIAEAQHRAAASRRIIDIRIFGFVSPFIDLEGGYFLSELFAALLAQRVFKTAPDDMTRDYVGEEEVAQLIDCCVGHERVNTAVDIYTGCPAGKFDLLRRLEKMGLRWEIDPAIPSHPERVTYASTWRHAHEFGYRPARTAMEVVESAVRALMTDRLGISV